jgi:hypothetical protein
MASDFGQALRKNKHRKRKGVEVPLSQFQASTQRNAKASADMMKQESAWEQFSFTLFGSFNQQESKVLKPPPVLVEENKPSDTPTEAKSKPVAPEV